MNTLSKGLRVLLDHNLPRQLRDKLGQHSAKTVAEMGWQQTRNGDLLRQAEQAGFDCLLTGDQNMTHQQSPVNRSIAIVVLNATRRSTVLSQADKITATLDTVGPGTRHTVALDIPSLNRRAYGPSALGTIVEAMRAPDAAAPWEAAPVPMAERVRTFEERAAKAKEQAAKPQDALEAEPDAPKPRSGPRP